VLALLTLAIATLSTNIAANIVSPANDFSALAPKRISFRTGGILAAILGLVMMPWKLMSDPSGYIFTWLIGYSALLGPIAGIMIADYFVWRKKQLLVVDLYETSGAYRYSNGFSFVSFATFVLAVLPSLPGFLAQVGAISKDGAPVFLLSLYNYAWFIGFALAFTLYLLLRKLFPKL
jgi:NCS1 family nucleobase:cation symporter-1